MKNSTKSAVPYGPKQKPWNEQTPDWASVTGPIENPAHLYDTVPPKGVVDNFPTIDYRKFEIPPEGLSGEEYKSAMTEFETFIKTKHKQFTGYQTNEFIEGNEELSWLLNIHTNNVGDPFTTGIFSLNTKFVERAVLDYFAALWRANWPYNENANDLDRYWGYVMSMGSTEGNIYALYNAREYLSGGKLIKDPESQRKVHKKMKRGKFALDKSYKHIWPIDFHDNPNKYKPIAFYSEDTHYSVIKGVSVCAVVNFGDEGNRNEDYKLKCPITKDGVWPDEVPSHNFNHNDPKSGTIDVEALRQLVTFFVEKGHPIIMVLNQGSTWKGAYDNVTDVDQMLKDLGKIYPWLWERKVAYKIGEEIHTDTRRGFWMHIDGALGATYLPFLRMAKEQGELPKHKVIPEFDFSIDSVMSIVSSLHKWIGAPWPGGIYMTKRKFQLSPPDTAGYIGSPDTTLGGSRNGFSPMLYWKYFAKKGYSENISRALQTEAVAAQFEKALQNLEKELQSKFPAENVDLWIQRSELSLAVLFRKVNNDITYKYTVDSERILVPFEYEGELHSEERTYSHIYSMSSLGEYGLVDKLINDIKLACKVDWKNAFPVQWEENGEIIENPGQRDRVDA